LSIPATASRARLNLASVSAGCLWLLCAGFLAFVVWVYMAVAVFDPVELFLIVVPAALGAIVLAKPTLVRLLVSLIASVIVVTYGLVATTLPYNDQATGYSIALLGLAIGPSSALAVWQSR
jgi:hypothetical protein